MHRGQNHWWRRASHRNYRFSGHHSVTVINTTSRPLRRRIPMWRFLVDLHQYGLTCMMSTWQRVGVTGNIAHHVARNFTAAAARRILVVLGPQPFWSGRREPSHFVTRQVTIFFINEWSNPGKSLQNIGKSVLTRAYEHGAKLNECSIVTRCAKRFLAK